MPPPPLEAKGAFPVREQFAPTPTEAVSGPENVLRPTHRERTGEKMSAIDAGVRAPETPWRDEIRAMLQLTWPMILTNLGQTAMTATDVLMMGRLGPDALAAGSLGANLYFMPLIFGLGLMTAASPMIATELGRQRHSVRDVRRTVRQGLWLASHGVDPDLVPPLAGRGDPRSPWARSRGWRAMAGSYVHYADVGELAVLRLSGAALLHLGAGAAALGADHRVQRGRVQRLRQLVPDVRQSRLPGAWPAGLGRRDDDVVAC